MFLYEPPNQLKPIFLSVTHVYFSTFVTVPYCYCDARRINNLWSITAYALWITSYSSQFFTIYVLFLKTCISVSNPFLLFFINKRYKNIGTTYVIHTCISFYIACMTLINFFFRFTPWTDHHSRMHVPICCHEFYTFTVLQHCFSVKKTIQPFQFS